MTPPVSEDAQARFVGLHPWLPWPLSAWRWWTAPVRAERLAVLRIGLALMLLIDLWWNYRPYVVDFFAAQSTGSPEIYGYYGRAPRLWWSIFRGFNDPLLSFVAFAIIGVFSGYLILDLSARLSRPAIDQGRRLWPIFLWFGAGVYFVLSVWARDLDSFKKGGADWAPTALTWAAPQALFVVGWFCWALESLRLYLRPADTDNRFWWVLTVAWTFLFLLFLFGLVQHFLWRQWSLGDGQYALWHPQFYEDFLLSWQSHPLLLQIAFWLWFATVFALFLGWQTRTAAILAWALSSSFANINSGIDNAGDTVRGIILFYLMLCPCGAAYSLDAWPDRRRGLTGPVFVSPWPLRLLFIQMIFIYWCNGLSKLGSKDWLWGDSLYLVLSDVTLARFAHAQLDLPCGLTQVMTWTVLIWELTFPLLVISRWTRIPALIMGAMFHLGIFVTMELGGFAPYMWTLYLPFLPWERWIGRKVAQRAAQNTGN